MAKDNYEPCKQLTLAYEGGFSQDVHDPGGATQWGIIQREYDAYRDKHGLPRQSVRKLTTAECNEIYRTNYWDTMNCEDLPIGIDFAVYDAAVNSGPGRAAQWLKDSGGDIDKYCDLRLAFLKRLSTWQYFGSGWDSRVRSVRLHAHAMENVPSDEVKWVQTSLNQLGESLEVDGLLGEKTDAAVCHFQATHGLTVDGLIGPATISAIKTALPQPVPEAPTIPAAQHAPWLQHILLGAAAVAAIAYAITNRKQ